MEVTILGSGTATPSLRRNASGLLARCGDFAILVDIGPGILRRLCEASVDTRIVDAILITHFHPDHVSDLAPFLFASNYAFGPVREAPFHVVGPEGLTRVFEALKGAFGQWIVPKGDRLRLRELEGTDRAFDELPGIAVRMAPSAHSAPGVAYRIEADGKSVTVSGDTDVSDSIVELATETDVFICEAALPDGLKVPGHLTPSEAGTMAAKARAKKLVLTHFYPPCDETDVVAQAAGVYDGEIVRAEDLMIIRI